MTRDKNRKEMCDKYMYSVQTIKLASARRLVLFVSSLSCGLCLTALFVNVQNNENVSSKTKTSTSCGHVRLYNARVPN